MDQILFSVPARGLSSAQGILLWVGEAASCRACSAMETFSLLSAEVASPGQRPHRPLCFQDPHMALGIAPSDLCSPFSRHPSACVHPLWPLACRKPARRAHTACSCVPFRWGLCVRPYTFLEGPVFLTAAFPVADTQKVPGRQEHVHGCWWCRARPAGTGRPGEGAGWLQAGRTGGGTECWARLPGSTSRPPPFPPPRRKGEVNKPITLGNEAK